MMYTNQMQNSSLVRSSRLRLIASQVIQVTLSVDADRRLFVYTTGYFGYNQLDYLGFWAAMSWPYGMVKQISELNDRI